MVQTYKAELQDDKVFWLGQKPKNLNKKKKYIVNISLNVREKNNRKGIELVEFFRNSPLFGIDLDLTRDQDIGRVVEL